MADAAQLDVFFGDASVAETRVYVRLTGPDAAACRLKGSLRGPFCRYGQTLPATLPLSDAGPGATRLLRGVIPDPCFWSPDQPHRYRFQVELAWPGGAVEEHERWLGIRPLGRRGARLYWEGKAWVPRLIDERLAPGNSLALWREAGAVLIADALDERQAAEASEVGVPLAVRLSTEASRWTDEARRLARWPAVVLGLLPGDAAGLAEAELAALRRAAPNLLWGGEIDLPGPLASLPGIDLWLTRWATPEGAATDTELPIPDWIAAPQPVIMAAPRAAAEDLAAARAECDRLQARLAPHGQWAGYAVVAARGTKG